MKIAILTQPLGHNYGGIMQAWALQKVLKKLGHNPTTIDRRFEKTSTLRLVAKNIQNLLNANKTRTVVTINEDIKKIIFKYNINFIQNNIRISEAISEESKLKKHFESHHYEAVIVGSDQTWRPKYSPNIYNFFLNFVNDSSLKMIAYATSFGTDDWEYTSTQTKKCAKLAKKFDYIGVREASAVILCKRHLKVNAEHVLDPTLLLSRDEYEALLEKSQDDATNYGIYTYILDKSPHKTSAIHNISTELGMKTYSIQAEKSHEQWSGGDIEEYIMPSVVDWVRGFRDSKLVITDSYHGVIFSIIFNKPFIILMNNDRGGARFDSLLDLLDIKNRVLSNNHRQFDFMELPMDNIYQKEKLRQLREKSLQALSLSLQ